MRLSTPLKTTLSAAAALALLTACGGGSDDDASASSTSAASATSSSAAETSAAGDADSEEFCTEAASAFTDLESSFNNAEADPSALPTLLAQAAQRLEGIEPPAEISSAWTSFTGALDTAASSVQGLDLTTPEGQQAFSAAFSGLQASVGQDQTVVQDYLTSTCGIAPESPSTAAPTS